MATTIHNNQITTRKVKVKANLERTAFMFMRLSGIFLLLLAVGHITLQLVLNNVHDLDIQFAAQRWSSAANKGSEFLLMVFAFTHGINGLRNILGDYVHNRATMRTISIVLLVFLIVTLLWAGNAIFQFDPAPFLS